MSDIKLQATKMTDASVSFISLVNRGANRIPFKIVKMEKDMSKPFAGLDLGAVFRTAKADKGAKPAVVAVACMKGDHLEALKTKLVEAGFTVENMVEKEDGSVLFTQDGVVLKDDDQHTIVRLNDDVLLVTKGFNPYNMDYVNDDAVSFADKCAAQGFYPGVSSMLDTMGDAVRTMVYASANPSDAKTAVSKLFDEAKAYALSFVGQLPVSAFKMDGPAMAKSVKAEPEPATAATTEADPAAEDPAAEEVAKAAMSADEKTFYATLTGADKMKFMKATSTVRSAMMEDATDGGKDDASEKPSGAKKDEGTPASADAAAATPATEAAATVDVAALVTTEVAKASTELTASMKAMMEGLTATITKSVGEMKESVTSLQARVETAESVAKAAKGAVTGMVVLGSEQGDQVDTQKQEQQYVGREIDTAFQRNIRKAARQH